MGKLLALGNAGPPVPHVVSALRVCRCFFEGVGAVQRFRLWPRSRRGRDGFAGQLSVALGGWPGRAALEGWKGQGILAAPKRAASGMAQRRRHVVMVLGVALAASAMTAVATGSSAAWWAVLALLPLGCAYVAVLLRSRRIAAEREITQAFFGPAGVNGAGFASIEELFPAERERVAAGNSAFSH